jgi:cytochrome oxidase assembly protein ShyY1
VIRFLLAPRWIALHLATVAAIAGTLVLGSWQMRAYAEQEERERVAAANLAADAPATPIDDVLPAAQALPVDAVSRPVTLTGSYDAEQTLLLPERSVNGTPGWYVVTPIVAADGAVTPVLRGWVSQPTADAVAPPRGEVSLRGSLQPLETDGDAQVDPSQPLADGQVAALTGVAVFRSYPYPPSAVRQARVVLTDEQPAVSSVPVLVPVDEAVPHPVGVSAWRHLSYAWQWWLFAAAAVVFWSAFVRAGIREYRDASATTVPDAVDPEDQRSHQGLA